MPYKDPEGQAKYDRAHREEAKKRKKKGELKCKKEVLTHYGNGQLACVRCGFKDIRGLSIDHINGNRGKDKDSRKLYRWLRRNNYPDGYQTLCMNCQFIKREEKKEWANQFTLQSDLSGFST